MKAFRLLEQLEQMGITTITGVPDSTLKQFCDGIQTFNGYFFFKQKTAYEIEYGLVGSGMCIRARYSCVR